MSAPYNVPIFSRIEDGNASDKKLNNALLTEVFQKLADVGIDPAGTIYIADSALIMCRQDKHKRYFKELGFSPMESTKFMLSDLQNISFTRARKPRSTALLPEGHGESYICTLKL